MTLGTAMCVPSRIPAHSASSPTAVHLLEQRLEEFRSENTLLGRLLQETQDGAAATSKRAHIAQQRAADVAKQRAEAQRQLESGAAHPLLSFFECACGPELQSLCSAQLRHMSMLLTDLAVLAGAGQQRPTPAIPHTPSHFAALQRSRPTGSRPKRYSACARTLRCTAACCGGTKSARSSLKTRCWP